MTRLCELALKYDTDKCALWTGTWAPMPGHDYTRFYHDLFQKRTIRKVLEIGIFAGASLRMWAEYWPEAQIWGVDWDPGRLINEGRIHSALCDQGNEKSLRSLAEVVGGSIDLIIDDGSHVAEHQILSANILVPMLAPGGLYIIEDVQAGNVDQVQRELIWPHRMVEMDLVRKPDDRLIVIENQQD